MMSYSNSPFLKGGGLLANPTTLLRRRTNCVFCYRCRFTRWKTLLTEQASLEIRVTQACGVFASDELGAIVISRLWDKVFNKLSGLRRLGRVSVVVMGT
jgi:hypothetical protein